MVCLACVKRLAMALRMPSSGTAVARAAASTSRATMRPCGPDGEILARSMPPSAANRRASGGTCLPPASRAGPELRAGVRPARNGWSSSGRAAGGARLRAAAAVAATAGCEADGAALAAAAFGAAAPAPSAITATTAPTGATPPAGTRISASTPAAVAGTSIDTLSVSISNRLSPGLMASPAALNHCVILPSATVSPSCGISTSIYAVPARARHRLPRSPRHRDVLRLQKLHHPFVRPFAADARLLHAAEWGGRVGDQTAVEADHAEVELLGDAHAAIHVFGVEVGDQTVFGVVCALDHLALGFEALYRRHRTEDLLAQHRGPPGPPSGPRGRIEVPGPARRLAAGQDFRAFADRVVDQLDHLFLGVGVDQRAHRHAVVEPVADLERRHFGSELLGELVVHPLMHVKAVGRGTGLAHVAHLRDHRAVDRRVDVGV